MLGREVMNICIKRRPPEQRNDVDFSSDAGMAMGAIEIDIDVSLSFLLSEINISTLLFARLSCRFCATC